MAQVLGQPVAVGQVVGMGSLTPELAGVPLKVRNMQIVSGTMARDYADAIAFKEENHNGLYKIVCMSCFGYPIGLPIGLSLTQIFGGACLCLSMICPCLLPCGCSCERETNNWVTRGKHNERNGTIMCVDEQNGTLANYPNKCCSTEPAEKPICYCYRIGRNNSPLALGLLAASVLVHITIPVVAVLLSRGGDDYNPCDEACVKEQCNDTAVVVNERVCFYRSDGDGEWFPSQRCCDHSGTRTGNAKCAPGYKYKAGGTCNEDSDHKEFTICCSPEGLGNS